MAMFGWVGGESCTVNYHLSDYNYIFLSRTRNVFNADTICGQIFNQTNILIKQIFKFDSTITKNYFIKIGFEISTNHQISELTRNIVR